MEKFYANQVKNYNTLSIVTKVLIIYLNQKRRRSDTRMGKHKKKKDRFPQKQSFKVYLQVDGLSNSNCDDIIRKYKKCLERLFESGTCD